MFGSLKLESFEGFTGPAGMSLKEYGFVFDDVAVESGIFGTSE